MVHQYEKLLKKEKKYFDIIINMLMILFSYTFHICITDLLEELARDQMISMLERLFLEADVHSASVMHSLTEAKTLSDLQEALRSLLNDPKLSGAFRRQVAFLFDFEEIEHTTVAGLAMQDILKDAKHMLRPWELSKHRKVRGLRRAKVPQLTYSQVYCFYKVLPKHTEGPTIGFDYE